MSFLRIVALSVVVIGCSKSDNDSVIPDRATPRLTHARFHPVVVKSTVLSADTMFSIVSSVRVVNDSQLIAVDARQPFLRLIDRRTGKVVRAFGMGGKGPGEYTTDPTIARRPDGRTVWALDPQTDIVSLAHLDPGIPDTSARLAGAHGHMTPLATGGTTILLLGGADSTGLASLNVRTGEQREFGSTMRFPAIDTLPMRTAWRWNLTGDVRGCSNPSGDRIVRFHRGAARVEYLSPAGAVLITAQTPYQFDPIMKPDRQLVGGWLYETSGNNRVAYKDCAAGNDYVFVLFSGKRIGSYPAPKPSPPGISEDGLCEFVHVFDWNGKLVAVLQLDQPSWWSIDVDPKTLEMFGLGDDGIRRYDLKSALAASVVTPP